MRMSQAYQSKPLRLLSPDLVLTDIFLQASSKQAQWTSEPTTLNVNGAVVQLCGMNYQPLRNTKWPPPLLTGHQMAIKHPSIHIITLVKLT